MKIATYDFHFVPEPHAMPSAESPAITIPDYISARLGRPVPLDLHVVAGSTPVVSFGDCSRARVATLGLNPSKLEFLDSAGRELSEPQRRLETVASLRRRGLPSAADPRWAEATFAGCRSYFGRNPYRRWFDQLEIVLKAVGASYYDGSACHLDLVQWATDPTWGGLDGSVQVALLRADLRFLLTQLRNEQIGQLLINGRGVLEAFREATAVHFRRVGRLMDGSTATELLTAAFGPVQVIAWTVNLQSSFGVSNELRRRLGSEVARVAANG